MLSKYLFDNDCILSSIQEASPFQAVLEPLLPSEYGRGGSFRQQFYLPLNINSAKTGAE